MNWKISLIAVALLAFDGTGAQGAQHLSGFGPTGFALVDGVNVRNGNYAVTFSKFAGAGGDVADAAFSMTYNSLSDHRGWFGRGWGSSLEHKAVHLKDGSVLVRHIGAGAVYVYTPKGYSDAIARKTAMDMAVRVTSHERLPAARRALLVQRLLTDPVYRFDMALKYHLTVPPTANDELSVDRTSGFASDACPQATEMLEARAAYVVVCRMTDQPQLAAQRPDLDEAREPVSFNAVGDLKEITNRYFGTLILGYRRGELEKLYGTRHAISVRWGRFGIVSMINETGEEASFSYDAQGRLTSTNQYSGESLNYAYDKAGHMVSIGYIDDTKQSITYDPQGRVVSVTQRNGSITRFAYLADPQNPKHHSTRVMKYAVSGAHSEQTFEFQD